MVEKVVFLAENAMISEKKIGTVRGTVSQICESELHVFLEQGNTTCGDRIAQPFSIVIIWPFLLGYLYIPISPPPQTCYHLSHATCMNGQYP